MKLSEQFFFENPKWKGKPIDKEMMQAFDLWVSTKYMSLSIDYKKAKELVDKIRQELKNAVDRY